MRFNEKPEVVAINWEGFTAHCDGIPYYANPHASDLFKRALWSKGWSDAQQKRHAPETAFDAYWIVDDVLDGQTKEGFQVYYGCPFRAVGTKQGEYAQLGLALVGIPENEAAYRVKLARRHGEHSVALIRKPQEAGSGKRRKSSPAIQNPAKVFDQEKITWEGQVITAMEEQGQIDHSDAQSILDVQIALADTLYIEKVAPEKVAAQILAHPQRRSA
jgi:hypothetical protein